jgi:hypothetical protein
MPEQSFRMTASSAGFDPAGVRTRTGPISMNYLYNSSPMHREILSQFSLPRRSEARIYFIFEALSYSHIDEILTEHLLRM